MRWWRRGRDSGPHHAALQRSDPGTAVPGAGTWVQLVVDEHVIDMVVAAADGPALLVATAREADDAVLGRTSEVEVAWPSPDGLLQTSATLDSEGGRRWRITLAGEPQPVQRRTYVRVPTSVHVHVRGEFGSVRTTTADLSETGLRCDITRGVAINAGDRVQASLLLDDVPVTLQGDVRRAVTGPHSTQIAVEFVAPYPAETLGRWLLAAQLRQRAEERAHGA